jgi:hypothetical protein
LLPEFFTLLGIEIFSASSFISALLDRDVPSPAPWLFQGAAAIGLVELFVSQGFVNTGSTDLTRFWINIFYLTISVCSVGSLNIYIATVSRNTPLASIFSGTVTVPSIIISGLFVSAYLSGGDVSFTPVTIAILMIPGIAVGVTRFKVHHKVSKPAKLIDSLPTTPKPSQRESVSTTPTTTSEISSETPPETPSLFDPLDLQSILREWEESHKKDEQAQ